eukprot:350348-Chlamydomonas_euryale.AAC.4
MADAWDGGQAAAASFVLADAQSVCGLLAWDVTGVVYVLRAGLAYASTYPAWRCSVGLQCVNAPPWCGHAPLCLL